MIDAYEIGIELALPAGLNAGLEEVGRDMAALDRAVAASGAGLAALLPTNSGTATSLGAVPPVRATRATVLAAGEAESSATGDQPLDQKVTAAVAPEIADLVRSVGRQDSQLPAVAPAAPTPGGIEQLVPSVLVRSNVDALVPPAIRDKGILEPITTQQSSAAPADPVQTLANAPAAQTTGDVPEIQQLVDFAEMPVVPRTSAPLLGLNSAVRDRGVGLNKAEPAAAPVIKADLAAAWPEMQWQAKPAEESEPVAGNPAGTVPAFAMPNMSAVRRSAEAEPGPSAAPLPVAHGRVRDAASAQTAMVSRDEPAAMQDEGVGDGGEGGGSVHLDGRLVGEWLTDRMARDAARPGAGTTFFDPRQAPAWTPSGVL